jgi:multicomponent Na+:H+ antiporter subunit D
MMVVVVVIPFAGALFSFFAPEKMKGYVAITAVAATSVIAILLAFIPGDAGKFHHSLGGWASPLGIRVHADGLSIIFLLFTAVTGLLVTLYARPYFNSPQQDKTVDGYFWPLWMLLLGGLNALYISADIFNMYILLELISLAAVALTTLTGRAEALIAALRYLMAAMMGSLFLLLGVAFLYAEHGILDLGSLGLRVEANASTITAFGLMVFGMLIKTALLPFHFWLPAAHSNATSPVSAILSALVLKGSYFMTLRIWFQIFPSVTTYSAAQFVGVLGAFAILWGSFQAMRQKRLKLLVAHSTISQIGYLFLLFPLTIAQVTGEQDVSWNMQAWTGGICQAVSHATAKAALFLAVGNIIHALGTDRLISLRDIKGRLPLTVFTIGIAGVSLMGLPPSGGFVAKWMLLNAVISSGQWWWIPVIILGSLLTAGYVFLMLGHTFAPSRKNVAIQTVPSTLEICAFTLALGAIFIGFSTAEVIDLLHMEFHAVPIPDAVSWRLPW